MAWPWVEQGPSAYRIHDHSSERSCTRALPGLYLISFLEARGTKKPERIKPKIKVEFRASRASSSVALISELFIQKVVSFALYFSILGTPFAEFWSTEGPRCCGRPKLNDFEDLREARNSRNIFVSLFSLFFIFVHLYQYRSTYFAYPGWLRLRPFSFCLWIGGNRTEKVYKLF